MKYMYVVHRKKQRGNIWNACYEEGEKFKSCTMTSGMDALQHSLKQYKVLNNVSNFFIQRETCKV